MTILLRRLHGRDLLIGDVVLALAVSFLAMTAVFDRPGGSPAWLWALTGSLIGAPLVVRRRWPVAVTGIVLAISIAALITRIVPDFAAAAPSIAVGCALYVVGLTVGGPRSVVTLAVSFAGMSVALLLTTLDFTPAIASIGFVGLTVGAPWLVGFMVRERRAATARATAQTARDAVSEERLRIARELHDIVAHSMSLIAVKAAIANHVAEARPQETRDALRVIEATSRGALQQLRQTVGRLRDDEPYAPAPGLGELPALAEQAAAGGVDARLDVRGPVEVPEAVGLSAYRIVQESLTNVVKHAAPCRCDVSVVVEASAVHIKITDDGRRVASPSAGGHGLIGIRERVAVYGGDFAAGPLPSGGFEVRVRLPYGPLP